MEEVVEDSVRSVFSYFFFFLENGILEIVCFVPSSCTFARVCFDVVACYFKFCGNSKNSLILYVDRHREIFMYNFFF